MNGDVIREQLLGLLKQGNSIKNSSVISNICLCWAANVEPSTLRDYLTALREERLKAGKVLSRVDAQDDIHALQYGILVQATVQNLWDEVISECDRTIIRYKVSSTRPSQNMQITRKDIAHALLSLPIAEVKDVLVNAVNEWVWSQNAHDLEQLAKEYGYYKPDWTPMAYIQLVFWFLSWDIAELQWHTFTDEDVEFFRKCEED